MPYRICVVCTGNICRSPMGEVILRELLERDGLADTVEVDSAGTGPFHLGKPADRRTLSALRAAGYDGSAHRARQLTEADLFDHDLVVVADRSHLRDVRQMEQDSGGTAQIALLRSYDPDADGDEVDDPYFGDAADFERCLREVEAACEGLVGYLRAHHLSAIRNR